MQPHDHFVPGAMGQDRDLAYSLGSRRSKWEGTNLNVSNDKLSGTVGKGFATVCSNEYTPRPLKQERETSGAFDNEIDLVG